MPYARKIYPRFILYFRFLNCPHFFEDWRYFLDVVRVIFKRGLFSGEGKSCTRTVCTYVNDGCEEFSRNVGSAKTILKWRQYWTSLSAEKPRLIIFYYTPQDTPQDSLQVTLQDTPQDSLKDTLPSPLEKRVSNFKTLASLRPHYTIGMLQFLD